MRTAQSAARSVSKEEAAALVRSGMWLDYGVGLSQPDVFDRALAARKSELEDVKIRSCLSVKPRAVLECDPQGEHFLMLSLHYSGYDRRQSDAGRCHYIPVNLGEIPDYYRRFMAPVDVAILKVCPADERGYFNFSATNLWHRAVIERARTVVVEVSGGLPFAVGHDNGVHRSEVDYIIQGEDDPAPELTNPAPLDVDRAVAQQIAAEIEDGACLQIGIGAMPNAVCALLLESGVLDLGVHTEMLVDGIADLYQAGRISGRCKRLDPGRIVYSFALGSRKLYHTIDRNPDFCCCPVDHTNPPHLIMQNPRVVSINNTTQIDLQGQAASESDGCRHLSGTGGQLQFVRGAYASPGGKSFICLASTYEKRGERRSRIVRTLTPGNVVTTPRSDVMYVVTEYGMVNLKGKSVPERAKAIIALAHPDFRESLEREAYESRLIPRGFTFAHASVCDDPDTQAKGLPMSANHPIATASHSTVADALVVREDRGGVAHLELNRPQQLNALSEGMLAALQRQIELIATQPEVRCVVLGGAGRAFCAGHDLAEMQAHRKLEYYRSLFETCSRFMQAIRALPVPVIARVHGIATAAGCQLVGACDLAIAADTSRFAVSGINVGLFCSTPSVALSRNVSTKRAFDMLVTGRFIDARTALEWGLINEVVPEAELDAAIERKTAEIAAKSPAAVRYGKAMFYRQQTLPLDDAYRFAGDVMARNMMENDAAEGVSAFLAKRQPRWTS
ncbi:MAG TPA: enoyl-CoA hydratase [Steroidobacteraceae bacterium]|nr:enoyl-CoA hydratase [Steroidobacteraceae bacterium]